MTRHGRMQHAPRRDASRSRRGSSCWRRSFRRTRRALDSTIDRIEASGRVIEAAERFGRTRPVAVTRQLVLVALWLAEAGTSLGRAARGLEETTNWIALTGAPAGTPRQLVETTARWVDTAGRLVEVSNRLQATFGQLRIDVIAGVAREPLPSAVAAKAVATPPVVVRNSNGAPLFIVNPRAVAGTAAGARKISRGRAPPFLSICTL